MSTQGNPVPAQEYGLGHSTAEYERLRDQARIWAEATERVLDRIELAPGSRCLDAGCGPGETMRQFAERVGPQGSVLGLDVDAAVGAYALDRLHAAGHTQCAFQQRDLTSAEPLPGGDFDLVYARLLMFHLPQRIEVLQRLWQAVRPGGYLVVQDYDLTSITVLPTPPSVLETNRLFAETFGLLGCDIRAGARMPGYFDEAKIGAADGTDVAGRLESFGTGRDILERTVRSLAPAAVAKGVTTQPQADATIADLAADATELADRPMMWPLMIATWKRKPS